MLRHSPKKEWLFIGDSTMRRLVTKYRDYYQPCYTIRKCENCELSQYIESPIKRDLYYYKMTLGLEDTTKDNWFPPDRCTSWWFPGSTGCANRLDTCFSRNVEYLGIPVAYDEKENTTNLYKLPLLQSYLKSHPKDVCVINTGLHDEARKVTKNQYVANVKRYLSIFMNVCGHVIWISISAVQHSGLYRQHNNITLQWNSVVMAMIQRSYPDVGYIDMFPMSNLVSMHVDNAHLNATFYEEAARFFT